MDESELIGRLSVLLNTSKRNAKNTLYIIKNAIISEILNGKKVVLKGLCTFEIEKRRVKECTLPDRENSDEVLERLRIIASAAFKHNHLRNGR